MPELPEVETIARALETGSPTSPGIVGQTILGAEVYWDRTIEQPDARQFVKRITGQHINNIGRRGKYLVFTLSEDTLLVHLRMSGDLLVGPAGESLADHVRVSILLSEGLQLAFNNPRKFGRMWLLADPQEHLARLGPEPLGSDLTAELFADRLLTRRRQLKPLLLDQGFIAGLGNIYVDEALHLSKLHPLRRANTLQTAQTAALFSAIREVLTEGIRRNGASIDWVYRGGEYQNQFRVYQRTDEPCPECGTPIRRIIVGQRGTHVCPVCQPAPEEE
jgi:formamidopyrimidine-DNA glycosylase